MKYSDGEQILLGDVIEMYPGIKGQVVCSLEDRQFSLICPEKEWAQMKVGIIVKSDKGGLVHFEGPEPTFKLERRWKIEPEIPPANPKPEA